MARTQPAVSCCGPGVLAMPDELYKLLPWWILCAPLVLALLDLARTPRPRR